ncbi:MAG TPA: zinc-ribbon domain-containing protein, partial [Polyangiaceae bacterium]
MDVRCNRCGTEYEFDDALISERGTTVKCTNCGLQFKVFPSHHSGGPERWVVHTEQGRELIFTTLRELQRGIADRKVGPGDLLTRGQNPPRPLSAIAELEPFFQSSQGKATLVAGAGTGSPPAAAVERVPRTLHGVAPPANSLPASGMADTEPNPFVDELAPASDAVPTDRLGVPSASHMQAESAPLDEPLSTTLPAAVAPPPALSELDRLDAAAAAISSGVAGVLAPTPAPPQVSGVPLSGTLEVEDYDK